jgi:receptor protein-tyrosine kinase
MGSDHVSLIEKVAERLRSTHDAAPTVERAERRLDNDYDASARASTPVAPAHPDAEPSAAPYHAPQQKQRRSTERAVDIAKLRLNGMIIPGDESTQVAEQYRIIKRPLLLKAFPDDRTERTKNGNLIMVTSARPGEGKTFTAVNLALSIALERDLRVLLIDADVHRPRALDALGIQADKGLTELLSDPGVDLSDLLIRASNIPNLTILPSGKRDTHATELFASQRTERLIDEIASRYSDRIVIIDTPPVLASSEPSVLSRRVGQIVVVVEAERTNRRAVDRATDLLSGCPNINLVLNKSKSKIGADEFGAYGYSYGYTANQAEPVPGLARREVANTCTPSKPHLRPSA